MHKLHFLLFLLLTSFVANAYRQLPGPVVIGDKAINASSAILQVEGVEGGFLPPRLTQIERDALTPDEGLTIFNTTASALQVYTTGGWTTPGIPGGALTSGGVVFGDGAGNLGQDDANFFWDNVLKSLRIGPAPIASDTAFQVNSTTQGAKPCPSMTEAQRDAIPTPTAGHCIFNTTSAKLNIYDGLAWGAAGGGGISEWMPTADYVVGDVVYEDDQIYVANADHTSGATFAGDIANWDELSPVDFNHPITGVLPVDNGGTGLDASGATDGQLLIGGNGQFALNTLSGTDHQIGITNASGGITITASQNISVTSSPEFVTATLSGLAPDSFVKTDGSSLLTTGAPDVSDLGGILQVEQGGTGLDASGATDGQLLIGGNGQFALNTLSGTDHQIGTTNASGNITITASQNISVTSSPTFAGLTVDNLNLDGNTIISTDTNGDILLNPDGTGAVKKVDASGNEVVLGSNNLDISNLLQYPSFEESIAEGSCTDCTASVETGIKIHGNQSLEVSFSAQDGRYCVTKATGAQFENVSMYVSCKVKTASSDIQFVAQRNGADVVGGNVDIIANAPWETYGVAPFAGGATSVGFCIDAKSSITADVYVDDCKLKTVPDDYGIANVTENQTLHVSTRTGSGSSTSNVPYYTNIDVADTQRLFSYTNNSTDGFYITALRDIPRISVVFAANISTGNNNVLIKSNEANFATDKAVAINDSTDARYLSAGNAGSTYGKNAIYIGPLNKGEIIYGRYSGGTPVDGSFRMFITASAESEHILTPAKSDPRIFTARILNPSGTASIDSQGGFNINGQNAIASVNRSSAGVVDITFTTDFFGVAPVVSAVRIGSSWGYTISATQATTTGVTISTGSATPALSDQSFDIVIVRNASDVRAPSPLMANLVQRTAYVKHVTANNTAGGGPTSGDWRDRTLNTVEGDTDFLSLSSNEITLRPGKYIISSWQNMYAVNDVQARLRDTTNSTTIATSGGHSADSAVNVTTKVNVDAVITITQATTYKLQVKVGLTNSTNGYGRAMNFGEQLTHAAIKITKVK